MPKTKINVNESIKKMDAALNKLEEGFIDSDLNQEEAKEVVKQHRRCYCLSRKNKV